MLIYFESQALMLCYGAVLLRGSDVRSHEDFAAVSHSLNCGTPAPRFYCFSASWPLRRVSARSSPSSACGTCAVCLR